MKGTYQLCFVLTDASRPHSIRVIRGQNNPQCPSFTATTNGPCSWMVYIVLLPENTIRVPQPCTCWARRLWSCARTAPRRSYGTERSRLGAPAIQNPSYPSHPPPPNPCCASLPPPPNTHLFAGGKKCDSFGLSTQRLWVVKDCLLHGVLLYRNHSFSQTPQCPLIIAGGLKLCGRA